MSSISVSPYVSPPTHTTHSTNTTHVTNPPNGTAQHLNFDQTTHNGQAVHTGTTHSNASSLGSLPNSQHIGQNVNTHA
jgi:hypothetical protein